MERDRGSPLAPTPPHPIPSWRRGPSVRMTPPSLKVLQMAFRNLPGDHLVQGEASRSLPHQQPASPLPVGTPASPPHRQQHLPPFQATASAPPPPPSPHPTSPAASEIQTESCPHLLKPPGVPPGALNQPQPHRNGGLPGGAASLASSLEAAGPLPGCIHLQEPGLLLPLPLAPPLWAGTSCAQVWALVSYVSRVPDPPTQVRSLLWAPEFGGRLPLQTQRPGSRTPSGAQGSILMSFKIRRKTLNF